MKTFIPLLALATLSNAGWQDWTGLTYNFVKWYVDVFVKTEGEKLKKEDFFKAEQLPSQHWAGFYTVIGNEPNEEWFTSEVPKNLISPFFAEPQPYRQPDAEPTYTFLFYMYIIAKNIPYDAAYERAGFPGYLCMNEDCMREDFANGSCVSCMKAFGDPSGESECLACNREVHKHEYPYNLCGYPLPEDKTINECVHGL